MSVRELDALLKGVELKYLSEPIDVRVIKDYGVIRVDDKLINLKRGVEIKIPRWLARKLASEGYVVITGEEELGYDEISRYAFLESQGGSAPASLIKLPKNFYMMYKDYVNRLMKDFEEKHDPRILEELEKSRRAIQELVNVRLRKIMIAIQMGIDVSELRDRLTYEEEILYSSISRIINEWSRKCILIGGEKSSGSK